MQVMRKFIIDLKSDGTIKWAEVADKESETDVYKSAIARTIKFIGNDIFTVKTNNKEYFNGMKDAYNNILAIMIDELSKRG